jgi:ribonuclease P protein component
MTTDARADQHKSSRKPARLRRRADFLRASRQGARFSTHLFTIQMVGTEDAGRGAGRESSGAEKSGAEARFGFTVTRKVAGAAGRNRIRRRLKEALRVGGALGARPGKDYVFVARRGALTAPFADIISQMAEGFARLDERRAGSPRRKRKDGPAAS